MHAEAVVDSIITTVTDDGASHRRRCVNTWTYLESLYKLNTELQGFGYYYFVLAHATPSCQRRVRIFKVIHGTWRREINDHTNIHTSSNSRRVYGHNGFKLGCKTPPTRGSDIFLCALVLSGCTMIPLHALTRYLRRKVQFGANCHPCTTWRAKQNRFCSFCTSTCRDRTQTRFIMMYGV